jgi:hypothetical protein
MSDERSSELLSALPRSRPHRRSDKRGAAPRAEKPAPARVASRKASGSAKAAKETATTKETAAPKAVALAERKPAASKGSAAAGRKPRPRSSAKPLRQPAQPRGIPAARRAPKRKPAPATGAEIVGTAVQAVGELTEIGLALSARALRNAVGRLPRP